MIFCPRVFHPLKNCLIVFPLILLISCEDEDSNAGAGSMLRASGVPQSEVPSTEKFMMLMDDLEGRHPSREEIERLYRYIADDEEVHAWLLKNFWELPELQQGNIFLALKYLGSQGEPVKALMPLIDEAFDRERRHAAALPCLYYYEVPYRKERLAEIIEAPLKKHTTLRAVDIFMTLYGCEEIAEPLTKILAIEEGYLVSRMRIAVRVLDHCDGELRETALGLVERELDQGFAEGRPEWTNSLFLELAESNCPTDSPLVFHARRIVEEGGVAKEGASQYLKCLEEGDTDSSD